MKTTKHFALEAALGLAVALCASSPVAAQSTITLTNTADPADQDSYAWGQATLTGVADSRSGWTENQGYYWIVYHVYEGDLTVSCSGLTPGATYRIGPTGLNGSGNQTTYSSVRASNTGSVELAVRVSFVGAVEEWYSRIWRHNKPLVPELLDVWHPGYSLAVARKQGSKYVTVLQGDFWYPY